MSWFEVNCAIKGYGKKVRHDYEVMRQHASLVLAPHVSKKDRNKLKPEKLFPLPGDKKEQKRLTQEEVQEIFNRVRKRRGIA